MNNLDGILSLLIACIELVLLINLLIFADKNKENILVFLILFLLTGYQVFEFLICGPGLKSPFMAYLAFINISFLPPLSFMLVFLFLKIKNKVVYLIFIPALFFILYYSFVINQFVVVKCTVLYAAYNYPLGTLYGSFYYLPILVVFILLLVKLKNDNLKLRQTKILLIGYCFIVIPVVASFTLFLLNLPGLLNAIESILCKFAFGYAVALSFFALNNRPEK